MTFNAEANIWGEARSATFIIAVKGGNHSKTVTVKQEKGIKNTAVIDQNLVDAFVADRPFYEKTEVPDVGYLPFAYDQGNVSSAEYVDYKGNSQNYTLEETYIIEVDTTQAYYGYNTEATVYCMKKKDGWRIPTLIELYAIRNKYKKGEKYHAI